MNQKTLSLLVLTPFILASCGGGNSSTNPLNSSSGTTTSSQGSATSSSLANSSSSLTSVDSATGFTALKSGLKAYAAHDNFGFKYARPSHTSKSDNDFVFTYTPIVNETTGTSSSAASSSSSSSMIDSSKPFTLGLSFFVSDSDYPVNFYLNGSKDVLGDDLLTYTYADWPTLRFAQGDKKPTNYSETSLTTYASMKAFYLDLSNFSGTTIDALNSAVRSIKGNETWTFPEGQRAQIKVPDKVNSAITYFLPLHDYLPTWIDGAVKYLQDDYAETNSFGSTFLGMGSSYVLKMNITSFKSLYTFLVTSVKAVINSKGTASEQLAEWTLINDSVLKPIKKYGDCLDTFNLTSTIAYSTSGLDNIDFSFDMKANLEALKSAYSDNSPSGFITSAAGGGNLKAVIDDDAKIPTPVPALSTYPEVPAIKFTSEDTPA